MRVAVVGIATLLGAANGGVFGALDTAGSALVQGVGSKAARARPVSTASAGIAATAPQAEIEGSGLSLEVVVFLDENGNGRLDPGEAGRVPGVFVDVGGRSARSQPGSGRAALDGLPAGAQGVTVRSGSLPPFYEAGPPVEVVVPAEGDVFLPVSLPVGPNRPATYLALGDSITQGDGSSDDEGYRARLERRLRAHFGQATLIDDGVGGATSAMGVRRARRSLAAQRPGYVLILHGTNDWTDVACARSIAGCETAANLGNILRHVKAARSLPFLATLPPPNTGWSDDAPPEREARVAEVNAQIRALAKAEGAVLVDLERAFLEAGERRRLFSDAVHPSDAGYDLIANAFFDAITGTRGAGSGGEAPRAATLLLQPGHRHRRAAGVVLVQVVPPPRHDGVVDEQRQRAAAGGRELVDAIR